MLNQNSAHAGLFAVLVDRAGLRTRLCVLALASLMAFSLCAFPACSSAGQGNADVSSEANASQISVTVQVDLDVVDAARSFEREVSLAEGSTVLDALSALGVTFNVESSSYGKYVAAVAGVAQGDYGSQSGWMYTVNGDYPMEGIEEVVLADGDVIVFAYATEFAVE